MFCIALRFARQQGALQYKQVFVAESLTTSGPNDGVSLWESNIGLRFGTLSSYPQG
jgi:hypothetical protein